MPLTLQDRIMELAHEGHLGIVKSKRFLRSTCWFPSLDKKMELMIKRCLLCQAVTAHNVRELLEMSPFPDYPWQKVAVDHAGPFLDGY